MKRYLPYVLAGLLAGGVGFFLGARLGRPPASAVNPAPSSTSVLDELAECRAERNEAISSEAALQRQIDDCKAREVEYRRDGFARP